MFSAPRKPQDDRIIHIAAEVAETSDSKIPELLLRLRDVLKDYNNSSEEFKHLQEKLWEYELFHVLGLVLKRDFSQQENGFQLALELLSLLVSCCYGAKIPNDASFHSQFLPGLIDPILLLLCQVRDDLNSKLKTSLHRQGFGLHKSIVRETVMLVDGFPFLAAEVVGSKRFLQLLMSDNVEMFLLVAFLMQEMMKIDKMLFITVRGDHISSILDEFVFKISTAKHSSMASCAMNILLLCTDICPPLTEQLLSNRYRGLKSFLGKWKGKGMDDSIRRLTLLLDARSKYNEETEKQRHAAITIQAAFRAFRTRRRLSSLKSCVTTVQQAFRRQKRSCEDRKLLEMQRTAQLESRREENAKTKILSKSRQLKTMEGIPAKTVEKFLNDLQNEAAVKIQAAWRGYAARQEMRHYMKGAIMCRAAMRIQRQVRMWLGRKRKQHQLLQVELMPSGLDDSRRADLQQLIARIRDKYPSKDVSQLDAAVLHAKASRLLEEHYFDLRRNRRKATQCTALMAQIQTTADLLFEAPSLSEVTPAHLDLYASNNVLAKTAAIHEHKARLILPQLPWWKKLNEEGKQEQKTPPDENVF